VPEDAANAGMPLPASWKNTSTSSICKSARSIANGLRFVIGLSFLLFDLCSFDVPVFEKTLAQTGKYMNRRKGCCSSFPRVAQAYTPLLFGTTAQYPQLPHLPN
jgi:hypothetical protein